MLGAPRKSGGPQPAAWDFLISETVIYLVSVAALFPRDAAYFFSKRSIRPAVSTNF